MGWMARAAAWLAARLPGPVRSWLYRLGPVTRALRGILNRSVPSEPVEVEVAAGLLQGARFELDLQLEKDMWLGTYEGELQTVLGRLVRPGMTIYDVGANIGYLTIGLARLVGESGAVVAFEPLEANVKRLRSALRLNHLTERVELVAAAVGGADGNGEFFVHRSAGMGKLAGSAGRQPQYTATREVRVVSLDSWSQSHPTRDPDWIKVDVEGGEGQVLAGAHELLEGVRPGWILELHGPQASEQVWRQLERADYRVYRANAGLPRIRSLEALDWKAYVIAVAAERGYDWIQS